MIAALLLLALQQPDRLDVMLGEGQRSGRLGPGGYVYDDTRVRGGGWVSRYAFVDGGLFRRDSSGRQSGR